MVLVVYLYDIVLAEMFSLIKKKQHSNRYLQSVCQTHYFILSQQMSSEIGTIILPISQMGAGAYREQNSSWGHAVFIIGVVAWWELRLSGPYSTLNHHVHFKSTWRYSS